MDKLTEKQEKKIKKKALEEKIRTYRLLFNLGVEEAVEQNVNDWILYHKQKEKARNVDDAKKNAEEKIKLLESLGLNNRSKKIRKVLYGRKKELADEKIDSLVISAKDEINSRMNYRPNSMENYEDDCLELFNVLIKYEIYSGCGESRHTMYNTCQNPRLSKPFVKIYGFGKEHPTDAVEELSKRFEILRNAYVLDYDIGFDVNTKRNRKNYYDARQNLRKIIRGKKEDEFY